MFDKNVTKLGAQTIFDSAVGHRKMMTTAYNTVTFGIK